MQVYNSVRINHRQTSNQLNLTARCDNQWSASKIYISGNREPHIDFMSEYVPTNGILWSAELVTYTYACYLMCSSPARVVVAWAMAKPLKKI